jgi:hypothetical protein
MSEPEQAPLFVPEPRLCRCWFSDGVLMCDTPEICYAGGDGE